MRKDAVNGYLAVFIENHPYGFSRGKNKKGWVYEHRYVMEQHLGRYLLPDEVVHHIDRNRQNNSIDNLQIMSNIEHSRLHQTEQDSRRIAKVCPVCNKVFSLSNSKAAKATHCSRVCKDSKSAKPASIILEKLVWEKPLTEIAKEFKVSDVTIKKWCKSYGIETPNRGHWLKE